jgi:thioredoxin
MVTSYTNPSERSGGEAILGRHIHAEERASVPTVELTRDNFESIVTENPMVIVDFWAAWCAPCRAFAPTFEAASERHADVVFAKVNTEEQQELAAAFNIRSIPTLMFFRERVVLYAEAGALPPAMLEEVLTKVKAVDMAEVHREIAEREAAAPGA